MNEPTLRFKGNDGQNFSEWKDVALGNVITIMSGISPSSYSLTESEGYPFLKVEDLNNCSKYQIESREYSKSTKNLVPKESIIFPKRGAAILNNKVRINVSPVLMDSNLMAITPIGNKLNFEFLYYKILNDKLYKIADTSTIPQINNKHILPYIVSLPVIVEQTKIANFLSAVDQKISQLTQKHDLLTQYKKGVMQQIFSRELRFKDDDGEDFPEWKEKNLSEIVQIVGGGTPDTSVAEYWQGDIQWFTPTEIKTKYATTSLRTITKSGLKNSSAKILPVGTLLFSSRATVGDVSVALNECTTNQGFQSMIVDDKNNNEFIYYWILNNKNAFLEKASGSTFLEISKKEIEKLPVKCPSIKEQIKIANFLTAIDDKITSTQSQLQAVKQYKQGLLQQMFV